MIIHIRKPRNPTRKHLELIKKKKLFSKGLVYKINMQKTVVRGQEGSYVKPLWKPTGSQSDIQVTSLVPVVRTLLFELLETFEIT